MRQLDKSSVALIISFLWILVFIAEQQLAILPGQGFVPNGRTTLALGAVSWFKIIRGEWWRLFTSPFLHGGPIHLLTDVVALTGVGATLQSIVGRAWFVAIFAVVATGGGIISLLTHPYPSIGIVGPAGAVMGVLATNFVCSFHFDNSQLRARIRSASWIYLAPALVSTFSSQGFPVDIAGHVGGTILGTILGAFLLPIWPKGEPTPRLSNFARIFSAAYVAAVALGLIAICLTYPRYVAQNTELIPLNKWPHSGRESMARSEEYLDRYPHDIHAHIFRGNYFYGRHDYAKAKVQYREALRMSENSPFGGEYIELSESLLAIILWEQGRVDDAKSTIKSACHSPNSDPQFRAVIEALREGKICAR